METPNVNNLNGVPNFGHGMPEEIMGEEVMTNAAEPEGVEVAPEVAPMEEPMPEAMPEVAAE